MDIKLLKHLGNIEQIAGIREAQLLYGKGKGTKIAEFYNAAGLRFTVVPDKCMDIFDLSYKGINLSFQSKNGLTSPQIFSSVSGEFSNQWSGGALATCGLDNVGGHCDLDAPYPTHGRTGSTPASCFGTDTYWDDENYILRASGEVHEARMYGRNLSLRRSIETDLYGKSIRIHDVITNFDAEDEPFMLLYHCNFGYPLLQADSRFAHSEAKVSPLAQLVGDNTEMLPPIDGRDEELYLYTENEKRAYGVLYNLRLGLGVSVGFDTENLPNFIEWKKTKSHDYVLAIEPCNTFGLDRKQAIEENKIAVIPAYSSIENNLEIRVLDGRDEIESFLENIR